MLNPAEKYLVEVYKSARSDTSNFYPVAPVREALQESGFDLDHDILPLEVFLRHRQFIEFSEGPSVRILFAALRFVEEQLIPDDPDVICRIELRQTYLQILFELTGGHVSDADTDLVLSQLKDVDQSEVRRAEDYLQENELIEIRQHPQLTVDGVDS